MWGVQSTGVGVLPWLLTLHAGDDTGAEGGDGEMHFPVGGGGGDARLVLALRVLHALVGRPLGELMDEGGPPPPAETAAGTGGGGSPCRMARCCTAPLAVVVTYALPPPPA